MLAALVTAAFALAPFDFFGFGPYDPAVPSPRQTLGIEPGARHTTYHEQDRVLRAIADAAPNRVRLIEYGRSTQGRPLRIAVISSERNLARLDDIRRDLGALADPRTDQDSSALLERTPAVVWINCTTHGDETASFESGQYLVYTLAASRQPSIQRALDEVVVVVNPAYNPDGHERFVTWYNSVAVGSEDPSAFEQRQPGVMGGRSNHYRFDLNRDRVAMSQVESRQEVAEVLRWNPQVYADQHGEVDTYFFPPCAMSVNVNLDRKRYEKWTEVFGKAHAQAFDEHGWLYFVRRQFDAYYPGYLDAWNSLTGAIGVTHETDGGSRLAIRRPGDRLITLRMGMEKHLTTALSLIETSAQRRKELLEDFATFKRDAKTGRYLDKMRRVLVVDRDPRPLRRLAEQLAAHGIESSVLARPLKQRGRDYWTGKDEEREFPSGTLVIDLAQSQGHLARALLEAGSDFEPEFVERQREQQKQRQQTERYPVTSGGSGFYDVTGWCLVFAHGLDAWTSSEAPAFERGDWKTEFRAALGKQGAVLRYSDRDDILAAFDLLGAGVKVDIADDAMQLAGQRFPVGTFLVLRQNNQGADLTAALEKVAKKRGVVFEALDTAYPDKGGSGPGSTVRSLRAPRIGVIFGTGTDITSFGSVWFALERTFKLPLTPLTTSALDNPGDLTCIVCPPGRYPKASARLKDWVRAGGTLILLEDFDWALGQDGFVTLGTKNGASLPGSLFRARLNKRSLYTAGYDSVTNIAVPVSGSRHLKVKSEGGAVVSFEPKGERKKLLSGWEWEDTEDALADTVWMHDEPVGRGHVIFLAYDPTDRAMWPGLDKLLLNAMLFGP